MRTDHAAIGNDAGISQGVDNGINPTALGVSADEGDRSWRGCDYGKLGQGNREIHGGWIEAAFNGRDNERGVQWRGMGRMRRFRRRLKRPEKTSHGETQSG